MRLVYKYFSNYFFIMITFIVTFGVAYIFVLTDKTSYGRYWLIPLSFLVVNVSVVRYHLLGVKAVIDISSKNICKREIQVVSIETDKRFNIFRSIDHYRLVDDKGDGYLFYNDKAFQNYSCSSDVGVPVTIHYLTNSKILLRVEQKNSFQKVNDKVEAGRISVILKEYIHS